MAVTDITEPGALSGIKPGEEIERRTYTVPLYEYQAQTPDLGGKKLHEVYGRGDLPMFQWVKRVQVGEQTFDIEDDGDRRMQKAYDDWVKEHGQPKGLPSPQEILKGEIIPAVSPLISSFGANVGAGLAAGLSGGDATSLAFQEALPWGGATALDVAQGSVYAPEAMTLGGEMVDGKLEGGTSLFKGVNPNVTLGQKDLAQLKGAGGFEGVKGVKGTDLAKQQNLYGSVGYGVTSFGLNLVAGDDPVKAAKKAGAGAVGRYFGNAILPGIGGFLGGLVGSAIGGRVICNELMKQGLLSKEEVLMDYKFTRDYLTPRHINGYHLWAVWVVKQMRKGRMVGFWKHIAKHRANEIAYIYGKKDKPDYLGKIYRTIGEPVCWFLGLFCEKTDWSTLYKEKEI